MNTNSHQPSMHQPSTHQPSMHQPSIHQQTFPFKMSNQRNKLKSKKTAISSFQMNKTINFNKSMFFDREIEKSLQKFKRIDESIEESNNLSIFNTIEWQQSKYIPKQNQNLKWLENKISISKISHEKYRPRTKPTAKNLSNNSSFQQQTSYLDHYKAFKTEVMLEVEESEEEINHRQKCKGNKSNLKYYANLQKYPCFTEYIESRLRSSLQLQKQTKQSNLFLQDLTKEQKMAYNVKTMNNSITLNLKRNAQHIEKAEKKWKSKRTMQYEDLKGKLLSRKISSKTSPSGLSYSKLKEARKSVLDSHTRLPAKVHTRFDLLQNSYRKMHPLAG